MRSAIAGDHYTVELIHKLADLLGSSGIAVQNFGTNSANERVTLQEIIPRVCKAVQTGEAEFGILACGTGVGVEIGANRFKGIRASLCRDAVQASNARIYDNANVLCLGSWYDDDFEAVLKAWLDHQFDGDTKRAAMLRDFDNFAN